MALTSYPAGLRGGALLKETPIFDTIVGNVFWVSSTSGGAGNPGTFNRPVATVAQALAKCAANNGDRIYLKPGHAETLSAAAAIALSVAGVTITGTGQGSNRPTFTWAATAATMTVSAASIRIENVIFLAGIDAVAIGINMIAGSTEFSIDRCAFYDNNSTFNFIDFISTTAVANAHDGLTITRCEVLSADTGNAAFVFLGENVRRFVFEDNVVTMGVQDNQSVIRMTAAKILVGCSIQRNTVSRGNIASTAETGDIFIGNTGTTNSGVIANNFIGHLDPLAESIINVTGCRLFANYSTGVVDTSGYILPAVDS